MSGFGIPISQILLNIIGPQQEISISSKEKKGSIISFEIFQNLNETIAVNNSYEWEKNLS